MDANKEIIQHRLIYVLICICPIPPWCLWCRTVKWSSLPSRLKHSFPVSVVIFFFIFSRSIVFVQSRGRKLWPRAGWFDLCIKVVNLPEAICKSYQSWQRHHNPIDWLALAVADRGQVLAVAAGASLLTTGQSTVMNGLGSCRALISKPDCVITVFKRLQTVLFELWRHRCRVSGWFMLYYS